MPELTHLSLFSGIGGLDLAAELAGFRTVGQCEWADYPRAVLEKHWPSIPKWRDVHDLTADEFVRRTGVQHLTCISGGFPCQPHSVIGKRMAENDERHLWPEFVRIVRELKPKYVIGENVNGLLSTIHESVCTDLESEGYEVWSFVFPACAVGAHHERYRVCILGISKSEPGFQADQETHPSGERGQTWAYPVCQPWEYLPGVYWSIHKPPVCGMADGIPNWMGGYRRYKERMQCYGNAVSPQQFYPVFESIAKVEAMILEDTRK